MSSIRGSPDRMADVLTFDSPVQRHAPVFHAEFSGPSCRAGYPYGGGADANGSEQCSFNRVATDVPNARRPGASLVFPLWAAAYLFS
jgi:hypothetical protein